MTNIPYSTKPIPTLGQIRDVNINPATLTTGDVVSYDATTQLWVNTAGGGGGSAATVDITDTNTSGTYYPVFTDGAGTGKTLNVDASTTPISVNPNTGDFTVVNTLKIDQDKVAVGKNAGLTQANNSIALNASGVALNPANTGLFINPIRELQNPANLSQSANTLWFNSTSKEICYTGTPAVGSSKNSLVFPIADAVSTKQSILFTSPSVITEKSIMAQLDNPADIEQVYTFGQSIPNRFVAVGQGANTIAYSSDGINWTAPATPFTSGGFGVAWNGGRGGVDMTTITLDEYGVGLSNRLDVVSAKYYNQGFQEMTLTISV